MDFWGLTEPLHHIVENIYKIYKNVQYALRLAD